MTIQEKFTAWWSLWRASGHNKGVIRREYELLDRDFPGRIKTAEEFLRKQDEELRKKGSSLWEKMVNDNQPVLKIHEDLGRSHGGKVTVH